ncbi:arylsulfatase B-like isoform X2 [Rhodnius prolixus]|uniref:arylsulfatase B-like isoform X2 n=1 Tax=Rhodnius prolixus TaxID=13249 RepID=UPI003D18F250
MGCQRMLSYLCIIVLTSIYGISAAIRPHIVIFIADDLGWNDVSFHGSDQIPTPNLDALAYNGVILNRHYVQPVCTPTRAALLTGRYPIHTSMQGIPILSAEPNGLPLDFKLLPEYLRDLGYRTHIVGKWHLGYFREPYTPLRRGFETFLGCYNGYTGFYDYIVEAQNDGVSYYGFDLRRNETSAWDLVGKYATDVFTTEAVRVIKSHPTNEPLFLYMAYTAVHATNRGRFLEAPQARVNSFKYILDPNRRTFAGMLSKMDDSVGDIVDALSEQGMLDNTIILFLSDNGAPSPPQSVYPNWGSNFPLRGAKETLWEGGVRSPSFIWSSQLQAHPRVSNQLFHVTDWLPTLYIAAGGDRFQLPVDLDGEDQWYTLLWNLPSNRAQALLNINERERSAAIVTNFKAPDGGDYLWKLVVGTTAGGRYDGFYNDVSSRMNPVYDVGRVVNSKAYRAVSSVYTPSSNEGTMLSLRAQSEVVCNKDVFASWRTPDCSVHPCLFDLHNDPCEFVDLAPNNTAIVQRLYDTLKLLRRTLVPQSNQPSDYVSADPARFNNTWSPWSS